jgi:DNA-binding response OmpR family regulator
MTRSADDAAVRRWQQLSNVLLLTGAREPPAEILPSLSLLSHAVRVAPASQDQVSSNPAPDAVLVDARRDLVLARRLLVALRSSAGLVPVIAIVTDGGWAAVSADWGADDLLLHTAGPGEVEARLRVAIGRKAAITTQPPDEIRSSGLVVNEATYSARMNGRSLDLTFKEFELLKFLAQHPGRVFTRAQLLQEVWGYDYFGGTRTVDVHVRRLRAKLGAENEALIGTVRNVGYRFVPAKNGPGSAGQDSTTRDTTTQDGTTEDSTLLDGAGQNSAAQYSAAQNRAAQNSAAQNSATRDTAAQDGATQNTAAQDGATQNTAAQDGATLTERTGTVANSEVSNSVVANSVVANNTDAAGVGSSGTSFSRPTGAHGD